MAIFKTYEARHGRSLLPARGEYQSDGDEAQYRFHITMISKSGGHFQYAGKAKECR